jgi:hypothetical protein
MEKTTMMMVRSLTKPVRTRIHLPVSRLEGRGTTQATDATFDSAAMFSELALWGIWIRPSGHVRLIALFM